METTEIYTQVVTVIKPYIKKEGALLTISNDSKILEDLGVNSARLVDIVLDFEDKFGIQVEDEAVDGITTIGDAVQLIGRKLAHTSGSPA